ncbi:glycosyltransferase [Uniformispora flossi]|uniref:glycosyltransferase n=1 Tax=Uniformispora flossi TaxID=3390723 RepID=UPI003C2D0301
MGIDVDSLGGSQRVIHTLAQGLGGRGHRVEVIGIRTSPEPFPYNAAPAYAHTTLYPHQSTPAWKPGSLVERLNPKKNLQAHRARSEREAAQRLLTERFRSVPSGYVVFGSPWAADWALSLEWPHLQGIGQYHESFLQAQTSANRDLILRHYPHLEKALFLSAGDAAEFERLRLPNVGVMPNPLSFFPEAPAHRENHRIAAVGRLDPVKRLDRLIDAFASVAEDPWELHLIGDGPEDGNLRKHAAERGVADRVVFRGRVDDMVREFEDVSILALSSDKEGRPMAIAEAAACGVTCVAFDLSAGVRELVDDGTTGILVPPGDVGGMAEGLRRLMADADLRRTQGAAAREHVRAYRLDAVLDRWEQLLDEIDR